MLYLNLPGNWHWYLMSISLACLFDLGNYRVLPPQAFWWLFSQPGNRLSPPGTNLVLLLSTPFLIKRLLDFSALGVILQAMCSLKYTRGFGVHGAVWSMVVTLSIYLLSDRNLLSDGNLIPLTTCLAPLRLTLKTVMTRMGEMVQPWPSQSLPSCRIVYKLCDW